MSTHKRIVITGTSRGLGRAMTQGFIAQGHLVFGCARNEADVRGLNQEFGPDSKFTHLDVTDIDAVGRWAQGIFEDGGPPDILINNAALMNTPTELWRVPADEFSQLIDVNIKGVFEVIRRFVPEMIDRGSGVIVNFSSGWGRSTSPEVAPYCATKWAIEGLTKALASELPRGMAAIPLNPGVIDTDMLRGAWGESAASYPDAESWAKRAVPFLLDLSAEDNGQSLSVPG